jgi:hypothetical protein
VSVCARAPLLSPSSPSCVRGELSSGSVMRVACEATCTSQRTAWVPSSIDRSAERPQHTRMAKHASGSDTKGGDESKWGGGADI